MGRIVPALAFSMIRCAVVMLYKSLVRSHLEFANSVRNPHRLELIKDLEKVQMRATKLVISIKNLTSSLSSD